MIQESGLNFRSSEELKRLYKIKREKVEHNQNLNQNRKVLKAGTSSIIQRNAPAHLPKNATNNQPTLSAKKGVIPNSSGTQGQNQQRLPMFKSKNTAISQPIASAQKQAILNTSATQGQNQNRLPMPRSNTTSITRPISSSQKQAIPNASASQGQNQERLPMHKSKNAAIAQANAPNTSATRGQTSKCQPKNIAITRCTASSIQQAILNTSAKKTIITQVLESREEHEIPKKKMKTAPFCPSMSLGEYIQKNGEQFLEEDKLEANNEEEDNMEQVEKDANNIPTHMEEATNDGTSERRKRGKTMCHKIHGRSLEERPEVILNEEGEPIGPNDKVVSDLSIFLGTVARNSDWCPLSYTNWKSVPNKEGIWKYVNTKFIIPEIGQKVVFNILNDAWRRYKHKLKKKYFDNYNTMTERLKHRPKDISYEHFKELLDYWRLETIRNICQQNAQNKAQQKWRHRMGPKRFAIIKERLRAKKNNQQPTQADMFIETRRKDEKAVDLETDDAIEKLQNMIEHEGQPAIEAFQSMFGKEKPGRVRCYGRTMTPTLLKKNQEMAAMEERHSKEVGSLKENVLEMQERQNQMQNQMQGLQSLLKAFLTQSNPDIDMEAVAALMAPPSTPRDANSSFHSSTSMHNPHNEQNNLHGDDETEHHVRDDQGEDLVDDMEGEEDYLNGG